MFEVPDPTTLALACFASFFAGFVDAFAGGGGLIQLPALLALLPGVPIPLVLGTNKGAAVFGTAVAAARYRKAVVVPDRTIFGAAGAAFAGALGGAGLASRLDASTLEPLVLLALVAVVAWTIVRPEFGRQAAGRERPALGLVLGAGIGLYDGLVGPGTGTFLVVLLVACFGLDFLGASAGAKVVNVATNLAALAVFVAAGSVIWALSLPMACANMAGASLGARVAIAGGAPRVRRVFQAISVLLVARVGWSLWT